MNTATAPRTSYDRIERRFQIAGIAATESRVRAAHDLLSLGRRLGEAVCGAVVNDTTLTDAEYRRLSRQPMLDRD